MIEKRSRKHYKAGLQNLRADPHHKGLYLTNGHRWVFRRVIPKELRETAARLFDVTTEFRVNFGTHHREEAVKALPEARAKVEGWLKDLRHDVEAATVVPAPAPTDVAPDLRAILGLAQPKAARLPAVDHALVLAAMEQWHQNELYRINRAILNGEYPDPRVDTAEFQVAAAERYRRTEHLRRYDPRLHRDVEEKVPGFSRALYGVLHDLGFAVPVSHAGLYPIRIAFSEKWLDILEREARWVTAYHYERPPAPLPRPPFRWNEDGEAVPLEPVVAHTPSPLPPPAPSIDQPAIRFTELVAYYQTKTKAKLEDLRVVERRFLDTIGDDKPITDVTEDDIIAFRNHLENIPAHLTRAERTGVPLPLLAAKYGPRVQDAVRLLRIGEHVGGDNIWHDDDLPDDADEVRPLADASIEKQLNTLKGMFKRARMDRFIERNPAAEVEITRRGVETKRMVLEADDIRALFTGPIFSGMRSPSLFWEAGNVVLGNANYWIPLIALWTGMRLEEIAQLLPSDVRVEEGVHFIQINETDPHGKKVKRLKSEHAHRQIPVHPVLIDAGFLAYVREVRAERFVRLFPELTPLVMADKTPVYSRDFSTKVWPRYREAMKVDNPRKPFHSLRHTFKAELKRRGISYPEQDALLGHGPPLNAGAAYAAGVQIGLHRRAEIIRDLRFEGFPVNLRAPEEYGLAAHTEAERYRT